MWHDLVLKSMVYCLEIIIKKSRYAELETFSETTPLNVKNSQELSKNSLKWLERRFFYRWAKIIPSLDTKKSVAHFFQNFCTTCSQKPHKLLMVFFATSHEHFQTTSPLQHLFSLYNFWITLYILQLFFAISYLLLHYPTISMLMTFNSYLIRSTNAKISITILSTVLESFFSNLAYL